MSLTAMSSRVRITPPHDLSPTHTKPCDDRTTRAGLVKPPLVRRQAERRVVHVATEAEPSGPLVRTPPRRDDRVSTNIPRRSFAGTVRGQNVVVRSEWPSRTTTRRPRASLFTQIVSACVVRMFSALR